MIILTKEETALLLAIKGHELKILRKVKYENQMSYISRLIGSHVGMPVDERSINFWILELFKKLFELKDYIQVIEESIGMTIISFSTNVKDCLLSKIYNRRVNDLVLDESIETLKEQ